MKPSWYFIAIFPKAYVNIRGTVNIYEYCKRIKTMHLSRRVCPNSPSWRVWRRLSSPRYSIWIDQSMSIDQPQPPYRPTLSIWIYRMTTDGKGGRHQAVKRSNSRKLECNEETCHSGEQWPDKVARWWRVRHGWGPKAGRTKLRVHEAFEENPWRKRATGQIRKPGEYYKCYTTEFLGRVGWDKMFHVLAFRLQHKTVRSMPSIEESAICLWWWI